MIDLEGWRSPESSSFTVCESCGWKTTKYNSWKCVNENCSKRNILATEFNRIMYEGGSPEEHVSLACKLAIKDGWEKSTPKGCDYVLWKNTNSQSQSQLSTDDLLEKYELSEDGVLKYTRSADERVGGS